MYQDEVERYRREMARRMELGLDRHAVSTGGSGSEVAFRAARRDARAEAELEELE